MTSVVSSSDEYVILTGSADGTAVLWDVKMRRPRVAFKGHENSLTAALFIPGCKHILTGLWDKTLRLWDIQGQELMIFDRHEGLSSSALEDPEGSGRGKSFLVALSLLTGEFDRDTVFLLSRNQF